MQTAFIFYVVGWLLLSAVPSQLAQHAEDPGNLLYVCVCVCVCVCKHIYYI